MTTTIITNNGNNNVGLLRMVRNVLFFCVCCMRKQGLLDGNWINHTTNFEAALFKLHHRCIVDARALREDQNWWIIWIRNVLTQSLCNSHTIFRFSTFKPNMW